MFPFLVLALLAFGAAPAAAPQPPPPTAPPAGGWTFDWTLYLLAAAMDGEVAARGVTADVDVSFSDVLDHLHFGGMTAFRAGTGKWAATADVIYMDLEGEKSSGNRSAHVDLTQTLVEGAANYAVRPGIEVLGGLRYVSIDASLDLTTGLGSASADQTKSWVDPFIGVRYTLPFAKRWKWVARGDVGGFGLGSDFAWNLASYFDASVGKLVSIGFGYRAIYADYDDGSGSQQFRYDVTSHGPVAGVTFHF